MEISEMGILNPPPIGKNGNGMMMVSSEDTQILMVIGVLDPKMTLLFMMNISRTVVQKS